MLMYHNDILKHSQNEQRTKISHQIKAKGLIKIARNSNDHFENKNNKKKCKVNAQCQKFDIFCKDLQDHPSSDKLNTSSVFNKQNTRTTFAAPCK